MTYQTVVLSSYEEYLITTGESADDPERELRLRSFPHAVMLLVSYPELDYANRWCWQQFQAPHGECHQSQSEYPVYSIMEHHSHIGVWTHQWFEKTEYDYGFNEWYFREQSHCDRFLASVPSINWGEKYPK